MPLIVWLWLSDHLSLLFKREMCCFCFLPRDCRIAPGGERKEENETRRKSSVVVIVDGQNQYCAIWLILPAVICLLQGLSHASVRENGKNEYLVCEWLIISAIVYFWTKSKKKETEGSLQKTVPRTLCAFLEVFLKITKMCTRVCVL